MRIALNTLVLKNYSALEAIQAAKPFGAIEINGRHLPPDTPLAKAQSLLKDFEVIGIGAYTGGFTNGDHNLILAELEKYVAIAQVVKAKGLRIHPGGPGSAQATKEEYQRAVRGLKKAAQIAAPFKLYFELHHNDLADSAKSAVRLINDIECENLGIILDPANMYIANQDYLTEALHTLGSSLSLVHMKDLKKLEKDEPGAFCIDGVFYSHKLLGTGDLQLEMLLNNLKDIGYQGYLSLEYHGEDADFNTVLREAAWLRERLK